jgi:hypothetical protein
VQLHHGYRRPVPVEKSPRVEHVLSLPLTGDVAQSFPGGRAKRRGKDWGRVQRREKIGAERSDGEKIGAERSDGEKIGAERSDGEKNVATRR